MKEVLLNSSDANYIILGGIIMIIINIVTIMIDRKIKIFFKDNGVSLENYSKEGMQYSTTDDNSLPRIEFLERYYLDILTIISMSISSILFIKLYPDIFLFANTLLIFLLFTVLFKKKLTGKSNRMSLILSINDHKSTNIGEEVVSPLKSMSNKNLLLSSLIPIIEALDNKRQYDYYSGKVIKVVFSKLLAQSSYDTNITVDVVNEMYVRFMLLIKYPIPLYFRRKNKKLTDKVVSDFEQIKMDTILFDTIKPVKVIVENTTKPFVIPNHGVTEEIYDNIDFIIANSKRINLSYDEIAKIITGYLKILEKSALKVIVL